MSAKMNRIVFTRIFLFTPSRIYQQGNHIENPFALKKPNVSKCVTLNCVQTSGSLIFFTEVGADISCDTTFAEFEIAEAMTKGSALSNSEKSVFAL